MKHSITILPTDVYDPALVLAMEDTASKISVDLPFNFIEFKLKPGGGPPPQPVTFTLRILTQDTRDWTQTLVHNTPGKPHIFFDAGVGFTADETLLLRNFRAQLDSFAQLYPQVTQIRIDYV